MKSYFSVFYQHFALDYDETSFKPYLLNCLSQNLQPKCSCKLVIPLFHELPFGLPCDCFRDQLFETSSQTQFLCYCSHFTDHCTFKPMLEIGCYLLIECSNSGVDSHVDLQQGEDSSSQPVSVLLDGRLFESFFFL